MSGLTRYADFKGTRIGMTPVERGGQQFVSVTTRQHSHGMYRMERCGPDPLTPGGRLTASAVRTLITYMGGGD